MFLLRKPSERQIQNFISAQEEAPFSYSPLGLTRDSLPSGHTIDHNRVQLGNGATTFKAAVAAIQSWKMFDLGWVQLFNRQTPIETGAVVAVVVKHLSFWSLNACRI